MLAHKNDCRKVVSVVDTVRAPRYLRPLKFSLKSMVIGIVSEDKHVFEVFMMDDDGNEQKSMEIVYTKKKSETD